MTAPLQLQLCPDKQEQAGQPQHRVRYSGVWDPGDLRWCEVTFEQVFGGEKERPSPSPRWLTVRKVSSHQSRQVPVSLLAIRTLNLT